MPIIASLLFVLLQKPSVAPAFASAVLNQEPGLKCRCEFIHSPVSPIAFVAGVRRTCPSVHVIERVICVQHDDEPIAGLETIRNGAPRSTVYQ